MDGTLCLWVKKGQNFKLHLAEENSLNFTEHDWLDNKVPILNAKAITWNIFATLFYAMSVINDLWQDLVCAACFLHAK